MQQQGEVGPRVGPVEEGVQSATNEAAGPLPSRHDSVVDTCVALPSEEALNVESVDPVPPTKLSYALWPDNGCGWSCALGARGSHKR